MKRYTIGQLSAKGDPWNLGPRVLGPHTVVEADDYFIAEGFVTFVRDGKNCVSIPVAKVGIVSELTDDNDTLLSFTEE